MSKIPSSEDYMYEKIDRKSPETIEALSNAPVFNKHGKVHARRAVEGEVVITRLASGIEETRNTAKANGWVITNPSGEKYIVSENKFSKRYEATNQEGVFHDIDYCRAIKNPYAKPIEIMASWGSAQIGDENCFIADTCDADGNNMGGEPYLIEGKAFAETYTKIS